MASMTTLDFFHHIYGPDALKKCKGMIAISLLPKQGGGAVKTVRFDSFEKAADFCQQKKELKSVYYNLALQKGDLGEFARGTWKNVAAHFGLYFDIDLKSGFDAHKKKNHPETPKRALELFKEAFGTLKPSLVVHSGYGLHIYCLLPELVVLDNHEKIYQHQVALERAHQRLKNIFHSYGYDIDSVQDITRILRPSDTLNHKNVEQSVAVTIFKENKERYTLEEWMEKCPKRGELDATNKVMTKMESELRVQVQLVDPTLRSAMSLEQIKAEDEKEKKRNRKSGVVNGGIIVDLAVERPVEIINALQAESATFARDFNRRDIASRKDTSPSSYDMSIANACKNAGLSDQVTADIIIIFHRDHYSHTDPNWAKKLQRPDYLPNTIEKAKRQFVSAKAQAELEAAPIKKTYDPEQIKDNIRVISEALGVDIEEIIKYQGDNSQYDIILADDGGVVRFPNTERLITYRHFKTIFADKTGILIPPMKAEKWEPIAQAILNSSTVKKIHGIDNCSIVADYIKTSFRRAPNKEGWRNAHINKSPFIKGNDHYIFCETLFDAMRLDGRVMSMNEIAAAMVRMGCFNIKRNFVGANENRQQAWCWRVPARLANGEDIDSEELENGDEDLT